MTPRHPVHSPVMRQRTVADANAQPTGFRGAVPGFPAIAAGSGSVLRLPANLAAMANSNGSIEAIEVSAFTESMGPIEAFARRMAAMLTDGGQLVLDIDNEQSVRQLRSVVEGRPGTFDPAGSPTDPTRPMSLQRALLACDAAGLVIDDVVRVPAAKGEVRDGFSTAMFEQGLVPLAWLDGAPASRFWIRCSKRQSLAGTVLIGIGDARMQQRTASCVRAFLPSDWEVVVCDGASEAEAWSRGIADARGEAVWFLRAGATASAAMFLELSLQAALGIAVPAVNGEPALPGDLSGAMMPRLSALLAGPLPRRANTRVALEEHWMRLEAASQGIAVVDGAFASPASPIEAPAEFEREARAMIAHWQPIEAANIRPAAAAKHAVATPPWNGRKPRVSLCMIARDEERFLPECLRRAAPCVDEIIVVDTGSKDRTVEIAKSFGAKVIHRAWDEDFSAPRNAGIEQATGDWILVLDADEFLLDGSKEQIETLVQDPAAAGYHMRFVNVYSGGKTAGVMMVRLFRNLPDVRYQNVIHEQVTPSLVRIGAKQGLALSTCELEVEHHGYSNEVIDSRNKNERNERLFKKQLAVSPGDIYCLYKYGDFLRRLSGREADSRRLLEECLTQIRIGAPSLPRELPYAAEVAALCALESARVGETDRALAVIDEALRRYLPTPNLHYIAANLMLQQGQSDAAIAHFRRCLAYRGQTLVVPVEEGVTSHVSLIGIAQALWQKGDLARAERIAQRACELAPDYEVGQMALSKMQLGKGDAASALQTLTSYLQRRPDSAGACQQATLILQRIGCADQAKRMGRRAADLLNKKGAVDEAARMERILAAI
jgi:tetratricopeptide (TPR) repeat protein